MTPETLPQFFSEHNRNAEPGQVALRQKELGIWREYGWAESALQVRRWALGLLSLGFERGERVATIGDNDRHYLWGYLGLLAVGGVQVGLFTDGHPDEVAYIIDHCQARWVLAQDQEQVDKMLAIRERIPNVERVIFWEEKGLWNYDDPWLLSHEALLEAGRLLDQTEPHRFEDEVKQGVGEDLAIICYTSGTTGKPKGAMLTHQALVATARSFSEVDERLESDNHISLLPLSWIAEHALGVAPHCLYGLVLNFPEKPETVRENVREIAPENILYNSRLWDALVGSVQVRIAESSWINRILYRLFLPVGYRRADSSLSGEGLNPLLALTVQVGEWSLFRPLRDQLGFTRLRAAYTAGAALSPDAMRFFHALGINLKQIYGSTEVTGGATVHRDGDIKFASVGQPAPGIRIRIASDGEIQIGGPTIFEGYYRNQKATAEAILEDENTRWFRTGDAGYLDEDGHLIYLDRVKDMITLAGGERFSPQFIEGRLKFSPYIRDVMAIGGPTREQVVALVVIDFDNVSRWAERKGLAFTTFADLSQKDPVYDLVRQAVADVNANLPPAGRVARFTLLPKEFDADEAEMTRSRKLRRNVLYDRNDVIIEAMYGGKAEIEVETPVLYQDGSEGMVKTTLRLESVT